MRARSPVVLAAVANRIIAFFLLHFLCSLPGTQAKSFARSSSHSQRFHCIASGRSIPARQVTVCPNDDCFCLATIEKRAKKNKKVVTRSRTQSLGRQLSLTLLSQIRLPAHGRRLGEFLRLDADRTDPTTVLAFNGRGGTRSIRWISTN